MNCILAVDTKRIKVHELRHGTKREALGSLVTVNPHVGLCDLITGYLVADWLAEAIGLPELSLEPAPYATNSDMPITQSATRVG
jgi:hypothetical protein